MVKITWTNTQKKAAHMGKLADLVGSKYLPKWSSKVAEVGEETVNFRVLAGGTKKGGPRIETESMIDSVGARQKISGGIANISAGFGASGRRAPRWTIFQERGTLGHRNDSGIPSSAERKSPWQAKGIPAMLAIPEAIENMEVEADNAGMRMLINIAKDWDSWV